MPILNGLLLEQVYHLAYRQLFGVEQWSITCFQLLWYGLEEMSLVLDPKQRTALALRMVLVERIRAFNFCELSQAILTQKPGAIWISILMGNWWFIIWYIRWSSIIFRNKSVISEACLVQTIFMSLQWSDILLLILKTNNLVWSL